MPYSKQAKKQIVILVKKWNKTWTKHKNHHSHSGQKNNIQKRK
jgi:hypothetical protein